jgi:hypothetical protein
MAKRTGKRSQRMSRRNQACNVVNPENFHFLGDQWLDRKNEENRFSFGSHDNQIRVITPFKESKTPILVYDEEKEGIINEINKLYENDATTDYIPKFGDLGDYVPE